MSIHEMGADNDLFFRLYPETAQGDRGRQAYTGVYKATFTVNGVTTQEIVLSKGLSEELKNTGPVSYWIDAISSMDGTEYVQLGTGRSCHDS